MIKKFTLISLLYFSSILTIAQNELKLKAIALKDNISLGEQVTIKLSIEGIQSNVLSRESEIQSNGILDDFFGHAQNIDGDCFHTFIKEKPQQLGSNLLGPYSISVMGQKFTSNTVSVLVQKPKSEQVDIILPQDAKLGEEVVIKVISKSAQSFPITLLSNEYFNIKKQSSSTEISNGKFTKEVSYKVIMLKRGIINFNSNSFADLPKHVSVNEVELVVK